MFTPIKKFIANNSYGPTSAEISDYQNVRFVLLKPYEQYLINVDRLLYLLVSGSTSTSLKISTTGVTRVPTLYSRDFILQRMLTDKNKTKIVLDTSVRNYKMQDLLNLCIERGIIQL